MAERESGVHVYTPSTVTELLALYARLPSALLFNGGTHVLRRQPAKHAKLPANVINLGRIEELNRVSRTERHIDIGSAVTISRILDIGSNVLPQALCSALAVIGTPAVRNRATLGGNLCVREPRTSIFAVYLLLDLQLELRRQGAVRWVPFNRFTALPGRLDLQRGEVLTRIRVPFSTWDLSVFKRIEPSVEESSRGMSFCGLARREKDIVTDLRFTYGIEESGVIRARDLENELMGRKLPIARRELASTMELLDRAIETYTEPLSGFQTSSMKRLLRWFLARLAEE